MPATSSRARPHTRPPARLGWRYVHTRRQAADRLATGDRGRRAFGFGDTEEYDPFLLLDDFRNDRPRDDLAGFPWHPHRGIETITYVLAGTVDHRDSLGNQGTLGGGDIQWMTAGSGIIHQEMPQGDAEGRMHGFQLWANLPSASKMTDPRYQDVKSKDIPEITDDDGTKVRVVCESFWGVTGPVDGIAAEPQYLDVTVLHAGRAAEFGRAHGVGIALEGLDHLREQLAGGPAIRKRILERRHEWTMERHIGAVTGVYQEVAA